MTKAFPLYRMAKKISRVCKSSKDAETLNMSAMVEDAVYNARQVEILIFGDYRRRIKSRLFTDSEATLELIAVSGVQKMIIMIDNQGIICLLFNRQLKRVRKSLLLN